MQDDAYHTVTRDTYQSLPVNAQCDVNFTVYSDLSTSPSRKHVTPIILFYEGQLSCMRKTKEHKNTQPGKIRTSRDNHKNARSP